MMSYNSLRSLSLYSNSSLKFLCIKKFYSSPALDPIFKKPSKFSVKHQTLDKSFYESCEDVKNTPNKTGIENEIDEDPVLFATSLEKPYHHWTKLQIKKIYNASLPDLMHHAMIVHRNFHDPKEIQLCTLLSIKTGGCSEDCSYCAQSSRYDTGVKAEKMMKVNDVLEAAKEAQANGSTRFCLGAAWRDMNGRKSALKRIADMIKGINDLGMESCVTLGMIEKEQLQVLKDANLTCYNHNIDTSREHYPNVITTRTYDDRLKTIDNVNQVGISACTGGILGLGETEDDHISFLYTLSNMKKHPESLPINRLVEIEGTPKAAAHSTKSLTFDSILRTIATGRMIMPESIIRIAAGRYTMKEHEQFLCFMAGANAIFTGKKMLTTMCTGWDEDKAMLRKWGFKPMKSFTKHSGLLSKRKIAF
ncbi:biotin synthase [Ascoidea rubescens DSM 1968]|uniref:biotin synthase n=1 Tax=Ascoidea rubescens DSM 1968 TaxID=1344418 RepID=A0A1D2VD76_9ASCO|nr:biotin synthase long form [Ascoidea rubescens DSM 1968]ODV59549.1 biotin synthase long form [Ascoidea rubescens DSM 1968]